MRQVQKRNALQSSLVVLIGFLALAGLRSTGLFAADPPKPAKKDSRPGIKPITAMLAASVSPAEAKPGDTVTFQVNAKLDPGYHIYKYSKTEAVSGPVNTTFDFFDTASLTIEGDWVPSKPPERHKDPNFADVNIVEYFEDEVTWSIKLRVPAGIEPGKKVLRCQAGYMVCDASHCSIPGRWTLPDVVLTITGGQANSRAGTAEPQARADQPAGKLADPATAVASSGSREPQVSGSQSIEPANHSDTPVKSEQSPTVKQEKLASERRRYGPRIEFLDFDSGHGDWLPTSRRRRPAVKERYRAGSRARLDPVPDRVGAGRALRSGDALRLADDSDHRQLLRQAGPRAGRTAKATGLAIIYCLSIIGVFTAVGVLFSFFFSAASLQNLANNPWINLFVAALFVAFGLSLLGLFELRLPSFLLNASAQGESRGGLIGVVFMALTLTITSFTCTFPVVGGLLVMAARRQLPLPDRRPGDVRDRAGITVLPARALTKPDRRKMPRSGDWMNAVKVVGGLVEIGAALKFVNTAELAFVTPENAWFDAQVVLTSWIVLVGGLRILSAGPFPHRPRS